MNIVCKPSTPEDAEFLQELFYDVRSPEFLLAGLNGPMLTQLLDMQYRAQRASYATGYPNAVDELIWVDGQRAGRVLVDHSGNALELIDVAVLRTVRGQGVGKHVLQQLCDTAEQAGKPVKLSVRPGNPAQRLYQRLGFAVTAMEPTQIWMQRPIANATPVAEKLPSAVPPPAPPPEAHTPVVQDYSFAYFRSLVGTTLHARLIREDQGAMPPSVPLLVVSAKELQHPGGAVDMGDSFRLELTGSADAAFPAACIEITPTDAKPMAIFVSPLGSEAGRMVYEVVFNRMRRLA